MRRIVVVFVFCLPVCASLHAQNSHRIPFAGLNAYTTRHVDVFSLNKNTAALAQIKTMQVGLLAERKFLLSELNNYNCFIAIPASGGNFGLKAGYYGFPGYNQSELGVSYAKKLGTKLDLGLQVKYNGVRIPEYGNASAAGIELGTIWHISETLHTGLNITNPIRTKFGKLQDEKYPMIISWGFGFDASEKFMASAEIEKEESQPVNFIAGLQYKFIRQLQVVAGVSSLTSTAWLGVALKLSSFQLGVITAYHPQLGISPALTMLYESLGSKK